LCEEEDLKGIFHWHQHQAKRSFCFAKRTFLEGINLCVKLQDFFLTFCIFFIKALFSK